MTLQQSIDGMDVQITSFIEQLGSMPGPDNMEQRDGIRMQLWQVVSEKLEAQVQLAIGVV